MDADRWRHISKIFHAALERPSAEREAFLDLACGDDDELRREVSSLLTSHAVDDDFIDQPAVAAGAELLRAPTPEEMSARAESLVGRRLGPYLIEAGLGFGGMGVVWRARDTRLDRRVALKALAGHLGRDERSRERLRREAKAAASLSHPGIATVFALEELDGDLYIAYEYVEGRNLREELEDAGPADGDVLVETALALARGLSAAHDLGIVHRDLKPENIVRTADGGVKILDFGLASFRRPPAGEADSGEDGARLTLPGMLVGTPSYMSPEQLRGRDVDQRSDLFSLGVVLWELASGAHPFEGDDPASTIARILEVEPRQLPDRLRTDLPEIEPVLRRLLAKDPDARYANTTELVTDLERLAGDTQDSTTSAEAATVSGEDRVGEMSGRRDEAFWWWRFHQFALSTVYGFVCYGAWLARRWNPEPELGWIATALLYVVIAAAIVAGSLRLHLAFAARYYPGELRAQRHRARPKVLFAEFCLAGASMGLATLAQRADVSAATLLATLLIAVAVGILVSARLIEPTTTVAAFPPHNE
ncbi:MAG: serine/threonine-protein kinase [Acidobacteriota bacterium]|jgi:tRNA A-37 threonylcarbamoyl transferase component Bud32